jgi:uncharacterized RDD family membrane protein YckC
VAARSFPSRGTLTTAKAMEVRGIPNSFVNARAAMHSAEPFDPGVQDNSSHPTLGDESWRAEVALRVNTYRARRNQNSAGETSPCFDFGAAADSTDSVSQGPATFHADAENHAEPGRGAGPGEEPRNPVRPPRNLFDTNYYRRLNAETIAQIARPMMAATAAAIAPVTEAEAECEAGCEAEVCPNLGEKLPDDGTGDNTGDEPAIDLELRPTVAGDSVLDRYCISPAEPEPVAPPAPPAVRPPAPAQGNLIVFRRSPLEPPLLPQPSGDELAEPMNRRPRILEVPEDIIPAVQGSLFPEIQLDADEPESSKPREPEIEVPLRVAPVSERLMAALADLGVVMAAGVLLAAMACRALPEVPHTKPFWMMLGAATMLLWTVYQHLFLLYAGRTPGMSLRSIHLRTFDGRVPQWQERGRRARFIFVSFAAAALGFLWALVDEDALCWHDRVSQTFPTTE